MAAEGVLQLNVLSVVEDVLQQHGKRLSDIDFASRKAQEASLRRYDAAGWLRKMVGVVAGRDLPAQPSEEDFRLGLRSGIILCNVLNKIKPGAVPKVVEAPSASVVIPDGAALSAFQYFENVRNFLVAIEEMGIPTFEASDLESGGKSSRVVDCILGLKSYNEWKQCGGNGLWKFNGHSKQTVRKNSEPFTNFISRNEKAVDGEENSSADVVHENEVGTSHSLQILVRELLWDKNRDDIPGIVEGLLNKVTEEFERSLGSQNLECIATALEDKGASVCFKNVDSETSNVITKDGSLSENNFQNGGKDGLPLQLQVQELKNLLHSVKYDLQKLQLTHREEVDSLGKHLNSLAHAASGYRKVLEENRKLYNIVQDLKGNIRVYCRVRPFLPGQPNSSNSVEDVAENTISILTPAKYGKGKKLFTFNKVFGPNASQEEVFADTRPLIRSVLDGYNVCLFAYGQTGSGKTFTMTGPKELTQESLGVNYRALGDLFQISEQRKDTISYDISVQMMEIYNEQVRDLLVTDGLNKKLEIRNNSSNGINVPNANLVPVSTTSDVIALMNIGHKNRACGSTAMNDRSSRSHSCLTVHVQGRDLTSGAVLRGCMHLVDLAGSERLEKTEATGDRLKEAQHINRSLSALGDVIASLAQKNAHVPYRNSKLTQLLQDSLGGQAKTLMFVHISPEPDAVGETISTLKFAERVSTVELGAAKANKDSSADVKELKEQIASLRAALARKEGGEHHSRPSTPDRPGVRSPGSSPSRSSWNSIGDSTSNKAEESESSSRRHSLDLQDLLMSSTPWPQMEEENCDLILHDQKHATKVYPQQSMDKISARRRHSLDNGLARKKSQYDTIGNVDMDDMEAENSDSSEPENQVQLKNIHKSKSLSNVAGSKIKRPTLRPRKSQELGTRSLIPQPSRRVVSNGSLSHSARQPAFGAGRRKPASGK